MIAMAYLTGGRVSLALFRRTWRPGLLFIAALMTSFASFIYTSIANATLIGALTPALVLLVSGRVADEQRTRLQVTCALIGLVGITVVVLGSGRTSGASLKGDLFAVVNLLIWTAYLFEVKKVRAEGIHAGAYVATVFMWSLAIVTPWVLVASDDLGAVHGADWLLFAGMALGPALLGHGLMTWAQSTVDVNVVALLGLASPVLSTLLAWWIYEQRLTPMQMCGAAIVFVSLIVLLREQVLLARAQPTVEI
jgi:drug/metabolite transporter (DMT)-like permease